MTSKFAKNIEPFVKAELELANHARLHGDRANEFSHLENAHVIGQESTYWHVKVHYSMLVWGIRNSNARESFGQVLRIIGAATKTAMGLVPQGNTGGANVSPFKVMPIEPDIAIIIENAKTGS